MVKLKKIQKEVEDIKKLIENGEQQQEHIDKLDAFKKELQGKVILLSKGLRDNIIKDINYCQEVLQSKKNSVGEKDILVSKIKNDLDKILPGIQDFQGTKHDPDYIHYQNKLMDFDRTLRELQPIYKNSESVSELMVKIRDCEKILENSIKKNKGLLHTKSYDDLTAEAKEDIVKTKGGSIPSKLNRIGLENTTLPKDLDDVEMNISKIKLMFNITSSDDIKKLQDLSEEILKLYDVLDNMATSENKHHEARKQRLGRTLISLNKKISMDNKAAEDKLRVEMIKKLNVIKNEIVQVERMHNGSNFNETTAQLKEIYEQICDLPESYSLVEQNKKELVKMLEELSYKIAESNNDASEVDGYQQSILEKAWQIKNEWERLKKDLLDTTPQDEELGDVTEILRELKNDIYGQLKWLQSGKRLSRLPNVRYSYNGQDDEIFEEKEAVQSPKKMEKVITVESTQVIIEKPQFIKKEDKENHKRLSSTEQSINFARKQMLKSQSSTELNDNNNSNQDIYSVKPVIVSKQSRDSNVNINKSTTLKPQEKGNDLTLKEQETLINKFLEVERVNSIVLKKSTNLKEINPPKVKRELRPLSSVPILPMKEPEKQKNCITPNTETNINILTSNIENNNKVIITNTENNNNLITTNIENNYNVATTVENNNNLITTNFENKNNVTSTNIDSDNILITTNIDTKDKFLNNEEIIIKTSESESELSEIKHTNLSENVVFDLKEIHTIYHKDNTENKNSTREEYYMKTNKTETQLQETKIDVSTNKSYERICNLVVKNKSTSQSQVGTETETIGNTIADVKTKTKKKMEFLPPPPSLPTDLLETDFDEDFLRNKNEENVLDKYGRHSEFFTNHVPFYNSTKNFGRGSYSSSLKHNKKHLNSDRNYGSTPNIAKRVSWGGNETKERYCASYFDIPSAMQPVKCKIWDQPKMTSNSLFYSFENLTKPELPKKKDDEIIDVSSNKNQTITKYVLRTTSTEEVDRNTDDEIKAVVQKEEEKEKQNVQIKPVPVLKYNIADFLFPQKAAKQEQTTVQNTKEATQETQYSSDDDDDDGGTPV